MKICKLANCINKHYGNGLCGKHYQQQCKHPLYGRWSGMIERCRNPNNPKYHIYGGRGIKVCDSWQNFSNFVADIGLPPTMKHTLDRKDNDGNYEPDNVRWATYTEQNFNQRMNRRNTSGNTGVFYDKARGKWSAEIKIGNLRKRGRFTTKDEAVRARELWAKEDK